jgi:threonine dehydratase
MSNEIKSFNERQKESATVAQRNAEARSNRTPQQQLELLDKRLGKDVGAKRERTRLKAASEKVVNKEK